tara:strand:- start:3428 stop:4111 length:684 start_codon:yes stop_codon:yes gene_type:complete
METSEVPNVYQSQELGELLTALAKAQSEMSAVSKDSKNPFLENTYASLSAVINASREPLTKNGLSVSQWIINGHLVTFLGHASGQWLQSAKRIITKDLSNPQSEGSGITYSRRYSLMAILNLAPDDDDGNSATGRIGIGDAYAKLNEANALPHLQNIWNKHEPEWRNLFKRDQMEKIIEFKEYMKAKLQISQDFSKDKKKEKKTDPVPEIEAPIDPYVESGPLKTGA